MKNKNSKFSKPLQAGLDAIKSLAPQDELREEVPLATQKEVQVLTSPAFLKEMHTEFLSILPENIKFAPNDTPSDESAGKCWDIFLDKGENPLSSELAKHCASLFAAKLVALSDETGKTNFVSRLFIGNNHYRDNNIVFSYTVDCSELNSARIIHRLNFLVEPVK